VEPIDRKKGYFTRSEQDFTSLMTCLALFEGKKQFEVDFLLLTRIHLGSFGKSKNNFERIIILKE
jgi:hypothetical protein